MKEFILKSIFPLDAKPSPVPPFCVAWDQVTDILSLILSGKKVQVQANHEIPW